MHSVVHGGAVVPDHHVANQVLFLHDGVIHEQGSPDAVLKNPQTERTKGFLAGFTDFYF